MEANILISSSGTAQDDHLDERLLRRWPSCKGLGNGGRYCYYRLICIGKNKWFLQRMSLLEAGNPFFLQITLPFSQSASWQPSLYKHLLSFVELNNNLGMRLALNPTIFRICFEIFKGFYEIHIIQSILWKYIFVLPTFKQLKRIRGLLKILDNRT